MVPAKIIPINNFYIRIFFDVLKRIDINNYNVFVIELGTNGYVKPRDLKRLINILHGKEIYLCTIELPNRYIWKHEVNNLYFKTSKEYPNVIS